MARTGRGTAFLGAEQLEVQCAYWQTCSTLGKVGHEGKSVAVKQLKSAKESKYPRSSTECVEKNTCVISVPR